MATNLRPGDHVQTPLGKGTVREVRNNGRLLVDVRGRAFVFRDNEISRSDEGRRPSRGAELPQALSQTAHASAERVHVPSEIDLHGLTAEQALARAEAALNEAVLADLPELRFIHGRSGGRIRGALHRWLRELPTVRGFLVDPRNAGVTIVKL
jgi:DNA mismatch repair protein MutS2